MEAYSTPTSLAPGAILRREELCALQAKAVHVVGLASAEGVAVLRLLLGLGFSNITVHDARPADQLRAAFRANHGAFSGREQQAIWDELAPVRQAGRYGTDYLTNLETADVVVLGQGWRLDAGNEQAILERLPAGATVLSMIALYAGLLQAGQVVGITGTNGKSTTVALVDHLLEHAGVAHCTAGNDRGVRQFLPALAQPRFDPGVAVLEVSNRQLEQAAPAVQVAAITSLTPDHLHEHGGWDGYRAVKARLFAAQPDDGSWAVANQDDPEALAAARSGPGTLVRCSARTHLRQGPSVSFRGDELVVRDLGDAGAERVVATAADVTILGRHNRANACVAVACALLAGAPSSSLATGLASFPGKSQRLEVLGDVNGTRIVNDVKSTTPQATLAAFEAVVEGGVDPSRLVLIAGGNDKGLDYRPLGRTLASSGVRCLLVPGTASELLAAAMSEEGQPPERVDDARHALVELLEKGADAGVAMVLVSPAAAGFQSTQLTGSPTLRKLVARYTSAQEVAST